MATPPICFASCDWKPNQLAPGRYVQRVEIPACTFAEAPDVDADDATVWRVPVDGSPQKGPSDALVTIVEFADFQCPFCFRVESTVEEVLRAYRGKVRLVWKHQPLAFHDLGRGPDERRRRPDLVRRVGDESPLVLEGRPVLRPRPVIVPADPSSAAFPLVAALIGRQLCVADLPSLPAAACRGPRRRCAPR